MSEPREGLFLVDKPVGKTSFDIVRQCRKWGDTRKVGHAGTLDPKATGLLAVALGRCTKLIQYMVDEPKSYLFDVKLGEATESGDTESGVVDTRPWAHVEREDVEAVLDEFTGRIEQVPPVYSAVKIDGKRAHELARAGEEVELQPRPVDIHAIEIQRWEPPSVGFRVDCGSGTYVRSLARDISLAVGTVGHATMIRRIRIGEFDIEEAVTPQAVDEEHFWSQVLSPLQMLRGVPRYEADASQCEDIRHGRKFWVEGSWDEGEWVAGHDADGRLLAVMVCSDERGEQRQLWPRRVMV